MTGGIVSANSMKQFDWASEPKTRVVYESRKQHLNTFHIGGIWIMTNFSTATYPQSLSVST
jgi:hypothetical protein